MTEDRDKEIGRLRLGHSISRSRKLKHLLKEQLREVIKEKNWRVDSLAVSKCNINTIGGIFTLEAWTEFPDTDGSYTSDNKS